MCIRLLLLAILLPFSCIGQNYSSLIGKTYNHPKELPELAHCGSGDARVTPDRFIARSFFDDRSGKHVVLFEKEFQENGQDRYRILDVVVVERKNKNSVLSIGSDENPETQEVYSFILATECCYDLDPDKWYWPNISRRVTRAWGFNKITGKIEKLKANKLHRINEGYYRK